MHMCPLPVHQLILPRLKDEILQWGNGGVLLHIVPTSFSPEFDGQDVNLIAMLGIQSR